MDTQKRVMFVDDEEGVRSGWNRFFSLAGYDVTTAEDGARAIDRLKEEPVDVVVSDLKMPGVDGVKLLEWLHDEQPDTRFILLTGYGNEDVERQVRDLGAFEYLNKPISPDTLSAVVTAATILDQAATRDRVIEAEPPETVVDIQRSPYMEVEADVEADVAKIEAANSEAVEDEVTQKGALRTTLEVAGGLVAAPILGLAFVVFLPVIGFGALVWVLGEAALGKARPAQG